MSKDEIIQKIEDIKRLINLTRISADIPISEGGMSHEKAEQTIELFYRDIQKLEDELYKNEDYHRYKQNIKKTHLL